VDGGLGQLRRATELQDEQGHLVGEFGEEDFVGDFQAGCGEAE
jgi:hypothetical protein